MLTFARRVIGALAILAAAVVGGGPAEAQAQAPVGGAFSAEELVNTGNQFFGQVSSGLASVVEKAVQSYGQPNGYILGQEGGGAIFGGLRYGEGVLYTRNAGSYKVYWQGPTFGLDVGADGARTMMLVYNLPAPRRSTRASAGSTARPTWSAASASRRWSPAMSGSCPYAPASGLGSGSTSAISSSRRRRRGTPSDRKGHHELGLGNDLAALRLAARGPEVLGSRPNSAGRGRPRDPGKLPT